MGIRFRSKIGLLVAACLCVALVLSACATKTDPPSPPQNDVPPSTSYEEEQQPEDPLAALKQAVKGKKLTIGFSSTGIDSVAAYKAYLVLKEEFGLDVTYQALAASTMAAAVVSRDLDVGVVSLARIAAEKAAGGDPVAFGTSTIKSDYIVVAKSNITSPSELVGHVWGSPSQVGQTVLLRNNWLAMHGIDHDKDMRSVITGSSSGTLTALPAGEIDAALLHYDQFSTLDEQNPGQFHVLGYAYHAVDFVNQVWYAPRDWVEANRDIAQAINYASIVAARFAYDDPDGFKKLTLEYAPKLSEQTVDYAYNGLANDLGAWDVNGGLDLVTCEETIALSVESGALEHAVDCTELYDMSFQEESLKILGHR